MQRFSPKLSEGMGGTDVGREFRIGVSGSSARGSRVVGFDDVYCDGYILKLYLDNREKLSRDVSLK